MEDCFPSTRGAKNFYSKKRKKSQETNSFSQEQNVDPPGLWSRSSSTKPPVTLCLLILRISHYNRGLTTCQVGTFQHSELCNMSCEYFYCLQQVKTMKNSLLVPMCLRKKQH